MNCIKNIKTPYYAGVLYIFMCKAFFLWYSKSCKHKQTKNVIVRLLCFVSNNNCGSNVLRKRSCCFLLYTLWCRAPTQERYLVLHGVYSAHLLLPHQHSELNTERKVGHTYKFVSFVFFLWLITPFKIHSRKGTISRVRIVCLYRVNKITHALCINVYNGACTLLDKLFLYVECTCVSLGKVRYASRV